MAAVDTTRGGVPIEVIDVRGRANFNSAVLQVAQRAAADVIVVIAPGRYPQPGCLPALILALLTTPRVGLAAARLLNSADEVIEAGTILYRDLSIARYGKGPSDDPRWRPTRPTDACLGGVFAVRRGVLTDLAGPALALPPPWDMIELGLSMESIGLVQVTPAGAWATTLAPASAQLLPEVESPPTSVANGMQQRHRERLENRFARGVQNDWLGAAKTAEPRVLVCDRWVPRADRHAGEARVADVLSAITQAGGRVSMVCFGGPRLQPHIDDYESLGIEVFVPPFGGDNGLAILEQLGQWRPNTYDAVFVPWPELFDQCALTIRRRFSHALLVFDCIDLHHIRKQQERDLIGSPGAVEVERYRDMELGAVRGADVTLTVSEAERHVLLDKVPRADIRVLPLVYPIAPTALIEGRRDMLFVGGFSHRPNVDAVMWFVREILPQIRRQSQARLVVVGADAPREVQELAGADVEIVGHVRDVNPFFERSRVFVSPLRFGAGVKGKNIQAMARGLPLVTTSPGVEGTVIHDGVEALVRDDPIGFAEAVLALLEDDGLWARVSAAETQLARLEHAPDRLGNRLQPILEAAMRQSRRATAAP